MKNLTKPQLLSYILYAIVIAVFNLFFYMITGMHHPASVWIAYGFIHFSFAMVIALPYLAEQGRDHYTLILPMYLISVIYFIVEFLIGLFFIAAAMINFKASLLVQVLAAAVYLGVMIANMLANHDTAQQSVQHQEELFFVRDASGRLQAVRDDITDRELKKTIEKVYDAVSASPLKSHESVKFIEGQIMEEIQRLSMLAMDETQAAPAEILSSSNKILRLVNDRNRTLRLYQSIG